MVNFQLLIAGGISAVIAIIMIVIFNSVDTTFSENLGNAGGLLDVVPIVLASVALIGILAALAVSLFAR